MLDLDFENHAWPLVSWPVLSNQKKIPHSTQIYIRVQWFSTFFRFYDMLVFHALDLLVLRPFGKEKEKNCARPTECTGGNVFIFKKSLHPNIHVPNWMHRKRPKHRPNFLAHRHCRSRPHDPHPPWSGSKSPAAQHHYHLRHYLGQKMIWAGLATICGNAARQQSIKAPVKHYEMTIFRPLK